MTRPISRQSASIHQGWFYLFNCLLIIRIVNLSRKRYLEWNGARKNGKHYKFLIAFYTTAFVQSNEFVISVSYPVVLDGTFMGVSAVSIPLIELSQIAHPSLVGSRSYFFMLDNNGYAMFHVSIFR